MARCHTGHTLNMHFIERGWKSKEKQPSCKKEAGCHINHQDDRRHTQPFIVGHPGVNVQTLHLQLFSYVGERRNLQHNHVYSMRESQQEFPKGMKVQNTKTYN